MMLESRKWTTVAGTSSSEDDSLRGAEEAEGAAPLVLLGTGLNDSVDLPLNIAFALVRAVCCDISERLPRQISCATMELGRNTIAPPLRKEHGLMLAVDRVSSCSRRRRRIRRFPFSRVEGVMLMLMCPQQSPDSKSR